MICHKSTSLTFKIQPCFDLHLLHLYMSPLCYNLMLPLSQFKLFSLSFLPKCAQQLKSGEITAKILLVKDCVYSQQFLALNTIDLPESRPKDGLAEEICPPCLKTCHRQQFITSPPKQLIWNTFPWTRNRWQDKVPDLYSFTTQSCSQQFFSSSDRIQAYYSVLGPKLTWMLRVVHQGQKFSSSFLSSRNRLDCVYLWTYKEKNKIPTAFIKGGGERLSENNFQGCEPLIRLCSNALITFILFK